VSSRFGARLTLYRGHWWEWRGGAFRNDFASRGTGQHGRSLSAPPAAPLRFSHRGDCRRTCRSSRRASRAWRPSPSSRPHPCPALHSSRRFIPLLRPPPHQPSPGHLRPPPPRPLPGRRLPAVGSLAFLVEAFSALSVMRNVALEESEAVGSRASMIRVRSHAFISPALNHSDIPLDAVLSCYPMQLSVPWTRAIG
jgi:hypothetical protein